MNTTDIYNLAADDLACYAIAIWPGLELAAHHELMVKKLEDLISGKSKRLECTCHPDTAKPYSGPDSLQPTTLANTRISRDRHHLRTRVSE